MHILKHVCVSVCVCVYMYLCVSVCVCVCAPRAQHTEGAGRHVPQAGHTVFMTPDQLGVRVDLPPLCAVLWACVICICVFVCWSGRTQYLCVYACICMYLRYTHVLKDMHLYSHICVHPTYMCTYTPRHICVHTHLDIYVYIHT